MCFLVDGLEGGVREEDGLLEWLFFLTLLFEGIADRLLGDVLAILMLPFGNRRPQQFFSNQSDLKKELRGLAQIRTN